MMYDPFCHDGLSRPAKRLNISMNENVHAEHFRIKASKLKSRHIATKSIFLLLLILILASSFPHSKNQYTYIQYRKWLWKFLNHAVFDCSKYFSSSSDFPKIIGFHAHDDFHFKISTYFCRYFNFKFQHEPKQIVNGVCRSGPWRGNWWQRSHTTRSAVTSRSLVSRVLSWASRSLVVGVAALPLLVEDDRWRRRPGWYRATFKTGFLLFRENGSVWNQLVWEEPSAS